MDSTAIFQVADHRNREIFKCSLRFGDRIEVEHGLRRMLVGTISGIDNRNIGHLSGISRRSFEIVAHHDQINIIADHLDRVLEGLPF